MTKTLRKLPKGGIRVSKYGIPSTNSDEQYDSKLNKGALNRETKATITLPKVSILEAKDED